MRRALKIYRKLIEDGKLHDKDDPYLYSDYKDSEVRDMLESFGEELGFTLVDIPHTVYLVPDIDNDLLSFSLRDIRESVASSARLVEAFLQCYIVMTILYLFYGGKNNNPKQRTFLQIKDIVSELDTHFSNASNEMQETLESKYSINFKNIAEIWASRPIYDDTKRTTRHEAVMRACRLLERHKLTDFYDDRREIRTTQRLDDLMINYYLDERRIEDINSIFRTGRGD